MAVTFRNYTPEPLFGVDYHLVRDFLLRLNHHNYPFGRWDWMVTHGYLDKSGLPKIGLWLEDGRVVALATFDCGLGEAWLLADGAHGGLLEEMLPYAREAFARDGRFRLSVPDGDDALQGVAARNGFFPTQEKECDAVFPVVPGSTGYTLPAGFSITSMADTFDLRKYGEVLWKGFNHEANGEGPFVWQEEDRLKWELGFLRPNVDLSLKIAVVAPNGAFAAYCGMWWDRASADALVEPVATDPAYRRMGLGRAAVLEGIRRCAVLGAKRAFVGSSQQFYYSIGFRPFATSTWWAPKA